MTTAGERLKAEQQIMDKAMTNAMIKAEAIEDEERAKVMKKVGAEYPQEEVK